MTSRLVYRVALWDYLGENIDFNMDRIVIMREEYYNILIYSPQILFFPISLSKHFPILSFLYEVQFRLSILSVFAGTIPFSVLRVLNSLRLLNIVH